MEGLEEGRKGGEEGRWSGRGGEMVWRPGIIEFSMLMIKGEVVDVVWTGLGSISKTGMRPIFDSCSLISD